MEPTATNLLILALLSLAVGCGIAWFDYDMEQQSRVKLLRRLELEGHRWSE